MWEKHCNLRNGRDLRTQAQNEHCNSLERDIVFIHLRKTFWVYSPAVSQWWNSTLCHASASADALTLLFVCICLAWSISATPSTKAWTKFSASQLNYWSSKCLLWIKLTMFVSSFSCTVYPCTKHIRLTICFLDFENHKLWTVKHELLSSFLGSRILSMIRASNQ
jgi:hypothetical protein